MCSSRGVISVRRIAPVRLMSSWPIQKFSCSAMTCDIIHDSPSRSHPSSKDWRDIERISEWNPLRRARRVNLSAIFWHAAGKTKCFRNNLFHASLKGPNPCSSDVSMCEANKISCVILKAASQQSHPPKISCNSVKVSKQSEFTWPMIGGNDTLACRKTRTRVKHSNTSSRNTKHILGIDAFRTRRSHMSKETVISHIFQDLTNYIDMTI